MYLTGKIKEDFSLENFIFVRLCRSFWTIQKLNYPSCILYKTSELCIISTIRLITSLQSVWCQSNVMHVCFDIIAFLYPDLPLKGVSWDLYRTNILYHSTFYSTVNIHALFATTKVNDCSKNIFSS